MNKNERRQKLRQAYGEYLAGDESAVDRLAQLVRPRAWLGKCTICKQTVHTLKRYWEDMRCMPHRATNLSMRRKYLLTSCLIGRPADP